MSGSIYLLWSQPDSMNRDDATLNLVPEIMMILGVDAASVYASSDSIDTCISHLLTGAWLLVSTRCIKVYHFLDHELHQ